MQIHGTFVIIRVLFFLSFVFFRIFADANVDRFVMIATT